MSTLSSSNTTVLEVLGLHIFKGLNLFLPDHLVQILPVVHFLGFLGISGGAEIGMCCHYSMVSLFSVLSSSNASIFSFIEGKGITFLLHGVKIMDSMVWSFLYVLMPFTLHMVKSMSTMSVNKQVLIDPKIKSQMGLISLAFSAILNYSFRHFLSQHLLKLMQTS